MASTLPIRTFDHRDDFAVIERNRLPHWLQAGTIIFITWRTWDSMPKAVLVKWHQERTKLLTEHGIDPNGDWKRAAADLPTAVRLQIHNLLSARWEAHLNECHGQCVLRRLEMAQLVAKALLHFDRQRYLLTDFVIMPNHIHLLAAFPDEQTILSQCDSWKHFTAVKLNKMLGRQGRFWQEDQFDHLVRCDEEFRYFQNYIADNPDCARLRVGEYIHYQSNA